MQLKAITLSLKLLLPPPINVSRTLETVTQGLIPDVGSLTAAACPFPGATEPSEELLAILGDILTIPLCWCYSWRPGVVISPREQPLDAALTSKSRRCCQAGGAASAREKLL